MNINYQNILSDKYDDEAFSLHLDELRLGKISINSSDDFVLLNREIREITQLIKENKLSRPKYKKIRKILRLKRRLFNSRAYEFYKEFSFYCFREKNIIGNDVYISVVHPMRATLIKAELRLEKDAIYILLDTSGADSYGRKAILVPFDYIDNQNAYTKRMSLRKQKKERELLENSIEQSFREAERLNQEINEKKKRLSCHLVCEKRINQAIIK